MSFLKNVAVGLSFGTFAQILNALVGVLVIRRIGPHDRGVYATVLTLNLMVTYMLDFGISAANETFLGKGEHTVGAINCNSVIYSLGFGLTAFGVGLGIPATLVKEVLPGIPTSYILLGLAMIPITLYSLHAESILVGMEEILLINKLSLLQTLLLAGGSITFVLILDGGVKALFLVWASAYFIEAITLFVVIVRSDKFVFEPPILLKSIRFGLRAFLSRGLRMGSYRLDTLFVNAMMGTTAAGYYSVATALSEKVAPMLRAFTQAANRQITSAERELSYHLTSRMVRVLILFLVVALGPLIIGARVAVRILFGTEFLPAAVPLRILIVGVVFFCLSLALILFFQNQMRKPGFASCVIAAVVGGSSPLYLWAIPRWGLKGAATVTCFAFTAMFLVFFVRFLKISHVPASEVLFVKGEDIVTVIRTQRLKVWIGGVVPEGVKRWYTH